MDNDKTSRSDCAHLRNSPPYNPFYTFVLTKKGEANKFEMNLLIYQQDREWAFFHKCQTVPLSLEDCHFRKHFDNENVSRNTGATANN